MMTRSISAVLAIAGLAAAASGQFITTPGITARLDLSWQEDPTFPHNDNGFLETGEHALILMTASFTGQFTQVNFAPPIQQYSSGTILGLATTVIDIRSNSQDPSGAYNGGITSPSSLSIGPNADDAGASGYGVRGGWRIGGDMANGEPLANGFHFIEPGQFPADPGSANTTNPITNLDRLGWAPNSYADRTVAFSVIQPFSELNTGLVLGLSATVWADVHVQESSVTFGSVNIPIRAIPAPSGLLVLIAPIAGRRRRRAAAAAEASR